MSSTHRPAWPASSTVLTIGRDHLVTGWPATAMAMFGWSADEAIGRDLFELLACVPENPHDPIRNWAPCRFLGRKRHRDGTMMSCDIDFHPVPGGDGSSIGLLHMQRIDTDGGPSFEAEARYHSVVAAMQEGVVVQALDGRILACNPAAERILGLSAAQICGSTSIDPSWRCVHEDGSPFPGEMHPAMVTLETGQPQSRVVMGVYQPNGVLTWIRINSEPIRTVPGASHHAVVATFVDITEERMLQAEVRSRAEQLALVIEGANDGFWDWHIPSGRVAFSARWASMLGYSLEELAEDLSTWSRLVHPDDMAAVQPILQAHLRGETGFYTSEHRMRAKDGRWVWVLDRGKVVERAPDGRPLRAAGTHTDVTARREAQDKLRQALQANEQLVTELRDALERVRTLAGLLPVCAWCKSVRNDQGFWQQIEHYLVEHTDAKFTHGLCPECSGRMLKP
jgi:PAS domain S-box-containing protein